MSISTINGLLRYLKKNSGFSGKVIHDVILALGYHPLHGTEAHFKQLSRIFVDCTENGANKGFTGFTNSTDLLQFFQKNRREIAIHMELDAAEMVMDLISMVQNFGAFKNSDKPTPTEIGKALWDKSKTYPELTELYNVFSWYALEEISKTWYRFLEENPNYWEKLAA